LWAVAASSTAASPNTISNTGSHVLAVAIGLHDPIIVLGMLVEVLGRYPIAGRGRLACEGDVALEYLIGVAPDFDARTVAVEGLHPVGWARPAVIVVIVVVMSAHIVGIVIAAPATLVLTWSHDTFEILMHVLWFYRRRCLL
jgi:hypothetical protein